jgi:hypothetical protein
MQRLVEFVQHYHLTVRLAYYPPYHSKYNPIERCWGHFGESLEWDLARFSGRGAPVCRTMTWKGKPPVFALVTTTYQTGVKLTEEAMGVVESQIQRLPSLEKIPGLSTSLLLDTN